MTEETDYIVVGAGSAGAIVASRLAETGARVLLLEAGGWDRSRFVRVPGMITIVHSVPQIKKRFDWGYRTVAQENAAGRQIPTTRGKLVGGSSAVNGMLFVRGHRSNYDDWAAEGCKGWSFDDVLPAFKRMENWEGGSSDLRGAGGPVQVTRQKDLTPASSALIDAMSESLDVAKNDDYNGASQEGVGVVQMSAHNGTRFSTSHAYLRDTRRTAPQVETGAMVSRVVIEGGRAVGVEVLGKSGPRVIRAAREVVLSAGVVGSAQILMLSGVGPADHLRGLGIDVAADLPVGKNLHDHLFVPMTFLAPTARHRGTAPHFLNGILSEATRGDTWLGRTVFDSMAFVRTDPSSARPDLQIHTLPWSYPSPNQDKSVRHAVDRRPALTVMPTLIYPKSRGEIRLASADPAAAPLIDPAYLADPDDARFLIDGMKRVREVMASRHLAGVVTGELHPGPDVRDDAALARELPNRIHSVYHPVGTCRMGTDERAVVDPELRVRGIEGLRVADASIMPSVTGGNTNAPAMMIGERCAELMQSC
ncbi:GMC family oxidoreductase N-terminal domain-containing protein [Saccharopolyspora oryzae]|uniref:GMC family oxidoreductase N-terminal domain-containing protein n=1 Tax=Saccharopolyspora oryzae TaxID=2997343 RepID=A0ABT4VA57_9PSEU|nr:GMC family oxidoreductase N-terminal domain-containing protein [Saccharopolyspora oryzae]MDA3630854.1 GMC family oxidoreductase N-terminal domain-containing protein [Saccharopolyspora oryzae]